MAAAPFHLEFPGGIRICDTGNTVVRSRLRKMGCSSSRCNSNSYRQCNRGIQHSSSSLLVSLSLTSSMRRASEGGSVSAANTGVYCFVPCQSRGRSSILPNILDRELRSVF
jgi:hypothetical protein